MESSDLQEAEMTYEPEKVFHIVIGGGKRIVYRPHDGDVCVFHNDVWAPLSTIMANDSLLKDLTNERWQEGSQYTDVLEAVLAAVQKSRVQEFVYETDFFVGYYLGLRLWETLITQLEFRLRYFNDENLRWVVDTCRPQLDTGKIVIPATGPVMAFGSFTLAIPQVPASMDATVVRVGHTYGQWRSLSKLCDLVHEISRGFINWDFIIEYTFRCRLELYSFCQEKRVDFNTIQTTAYDVLAQTRRV